MPVTITGANLAQARVSIGGVEIPADEVLHNTNTHIVFRLPAGSTGTPVTVDSMKLTEYASVLSGPISISTATGMSSPSQEFVATRLEITGSLVTQGVSPVDGAQGYPIIKGKDTLVQFFVQTAGQDAADHLAMIGGAKCEILLPDGTIVGSVPGAAGVGGILRAPPIGVTNTTVNTSVNCLIPKNLLEESDTYRFRAALTSPPVEIAEQRWEGITVGVAEQVDTTRFFDTIVPTVVVVPIVPFEGQGVAASFDATRFWEHFQQSVDALKRIFPAKDMNVVVLPNYFSFPALLDDHGQIGLTGAGANRAFLLEILPAMQQLHGLLSEYNCLDWSVVDHVSTCSADNPDPAMFVTGIIDIDLQKGNATGVAMPPRSTIAKVVQGALEEDIPIAGPVAAFLNDMASSTACGLTFGRFCPDPLKEAVEALLSSLPVATGSESFVFLRPNDTAHTWAQELAHNLGLVDPSAQNHDQANVTHSIYDESSAERRISDVIGRTVVNIPKLLEFSDAPDNLPKSVMAFVPGHNDDNSFFEVVDYNKIFAGLKLGGSLQSGPLKSPYLGAYSEGRSIRIQGVIDLIEQELTFFESKLVAGVPATDQLPGSPIKLAFLDSSGVVIAEAGIAFTLGILGDGLKPAGTPDLWPVLFSATVPVPDGTSNMEVRLRGLPLTSLPLSANPPSVRLIFPQGGETFLADEQVVIKWEGSVPDKDDLTYSVYYSTDEGKSYAPVKTGLGESTLPWSMEVAKGTVRGLIKVVASDGILSAEAVSGLFSVSPKPPRLAILQPRSDTRLLDSQTLRLRGAGFDLEDGTLDGNNFVWTSSVDGFLGRGPDIRSNLSPGTHTITLTGSDSGGSQGAARVMILVLRDTDQDGLSDEFEEMAGLDPTNSSDAFSDGDGDGLVNADELLTFRTDPNQGDTDGDGITDGSDTQRLVPSQPSDSPVATPGPTVTPSETPVATPTPTPTATPVPTPVPTATPVATSVPNPTTTGDTDTASSWSIETINDSENDVGKYAGMAYAGGSQFHITYFDDTQDDLLYTLYSTTGAVETVVVMEQSRVGQYSNIAISPIDKSKHVSHYVRTPGANLGHAWQHARGGVWNLSVADSTGTVGQFSSIAVGKDGVPHMAYYDATANDLKHAWGTWASVAGEWEWTNEVVDSTGNVGQHTSIAVDDRGALHIVYYSTAKGGILKHAYGPQDRITQQWKWIVTEVLDPLSGDAGKYASLAIDSPGRVHVVYFLSGPNALWHASGTWNPDSRQWDWATGAVDDDVGLFGGHGDLAISDDGTLHIAYYDAANDSLKYAVGAHNVGAGLWSWSTEVVDGPQDAHVGMFPSIVVHDSGSVYITYYDETNGNLKLAYN